MSDIRYDNERLGLLFSDIGKYSGDLDAMNIRTVDDLRDKRNFYAVSMILFSLLNRAIDLGSEMVMAHNLGIPKTYREIFVRLEEDGMISRDLAKQMMAMAASRNLLSHEYHGITEEKLFMLVRNTSQIREFVKRIQEVIRQGT